MNNVNELNDAWIAAGQKVSDLQNKAQLLVQTNASEDEITQIKAEIRDAKAQRDLAQENLADARATEVINMSADDVEVLSKSEEDLKASFVSDVVGMVRNDPKVTNMLTSSTDEDGNAAGLTIPVDVQTAIHQLKRQFDSLEQYVTVEKVTTTSGSRVFEKLSDITPLAELDDESAKIGDNDNPKLTLVKYAIKRYAGITTVTNSLLKDTAENILAWLSQWIAKKVVVTRNAKIIEKMNAAPSKPTIKTFDDIKDLALLEVDPAIQATSVFFTNQSGFAVLSKVKDAMGNYLVQPMVTKPEIKQIEGKKIVVIGDKWLPNPANGVMPLYFGDLKQAVTLYDREKMSLLSTNIGGGAFEQDLMKLRVIDRFDVVSTDKDAFVAGSFKALADQVANIGASGSTGKEG